MNVRSLQSLINTANTITKTDNVKDYNPIPTLERLNDRI